jgi:hypothetical protein
MGRIKLQLIVLSLVLVVTALAPLSATAAINVITWENPTVYSNNTSIPSNLQASLETRLYYSYDSREWTLFATVPDGGTNWTGVLPLAEIVQGFYALASVFPGQGNEGRMSAPIRYPPPVAEEGGTLSVSLGSCTDTFVDQGRNSQDTYSEAPLIGTSTWPTNSVASRGFIKWDLSPLPPGVTVTGATLGLYYASEEAGGGDDPYEVSVAKVTGVDPVLRLSSWTSYDGAAPWPGGNDGGAANLAAPESSALVSKEHGWVTWDVTKMVQEWVAAPETNNGMSINAYGSAAAGSNRFFASRDYPDLYPRPQLVVTYRENPGVTVVIDSYTDARVTRRRHHRHPDAPLTGNHNWPGSIAASRGLIKWDLSSLPADATVTSAALGLYNLAGEGGGGDTPCEVAVSKVNGFDRVHHRRHRHGHGGAATWSERRHGGSENHDPPESSALVGNADGWVTWDVTKMVQEWVAAPETNHGMAVDADAADAVEGDSLFASWDHPDTGMQPKLVVTYTVNRP